MKKSNHILMTSALLICFMLVLFPTNLAQAMTAGRQLQNTSTFSQMTLSIDPKIASQVEDTTAITLTLAELGNLDPNGYLTLNGSYSQARFDLLIPPDWDILPGSEMNLHVVTDLGLANSTPLTEFTVFLNDYWVYETIVSSAGDQWITFTIPDQWGKRDGQADRLEIIVSTPEGCDQDFRISTYLYFDSEFTLSYQNKPISFDMSKYPAPIFQPAYYPQTIYLLMPSNASTQEVEAGLSLTAELGKLAGQNIDIQVLMDVSQDVLTSLNGNLIVIGTPENNPVIGQLQNLTDNTIVVSEGTANSPSDGILQLIPSPWFPNKAILLVTGLTEEAVYKAGRALGTEANFPGFRDQLVLVSDLNPAIPNNYEYVPTVTLEQLGYTDRTLRGTGTERVTYKFYLPGKYFLAEGAKIRFNFSHSAILDPNSSSITLTLNNTPFASAALDNSNKERGGLEAFLPISAYEPGNINYIGVEIDSHIADPCGTSRAVVDQAWVNLQADSLLNLPVVDNQKIIDFDLDYLPMPFISNPNLEQTKFVLPDAPSEVEYTVAFQAAALLGSGSEGNALNPKVLFGNPASEEELAGSDLIVVGRPSRNHVLQLINDDLPQPFIEGTDKIDQKIDAVIFRLPDNIDLGYLQLLPSKWGTEENVILTITGTSDQAMLWALDAMVDSEKDNLLKGNLVLTPNETEVYAIDTRGLAAGGKISVFGTAIPDFEILGTPTTVSPDTAIETPIQPLSELNQQRPLWLQIAVTAIGTILTIVVLFILYRLVRKRN